MFQDKPIIINRTLYSRAFKLIICFSVFIHIIGCKSNVSQIRNTSMDDFVDTISNIDIGSYNEIDWLTGDPSDGVIVYNGYKLYDIDNDGVDELFVLRQYVNNQEKYKRNIKDISDLSEFYKYAIRQSFISESYKIIDGKAEQLYLDNEPLMTQAFEGGHFGVFYFLLENGNIPKFYNSYWEENLVIYENMKCKTTLSHIGEPGVDEWIWELDGQRTVKDGALRHINNIHLLP